MKRFVSFSSLVLALGISGAAFAQQSSGASDDNGFAQQLWNQLTAADLVGDDAIRSRPYKGREPHGAILEFLARPISVGETDGVVLVKKNYGGENVTTESVWADGGDALMATTVMYQRESGYDPEHGNWFWAKYGPDGTVQSAGKVESCITCHQDAPGNDFIYSYDPGS